MITSASLALLSVAAVAGQAQYRVEHLSVEHLEVPVELSGDGKTGKIDGKDILRRGHRLPLRIGLLRTARATTTTTKRKRLHSVVLSVA